MPLAQKPAPEFRKEWFYEYFEWPNPEGVTPHRGIRTESHKLIQYTMNGNEHEMYDLHADPHETTNLYGQPAYAQVQVQLMRRMNELSNQIPTRKGSDVG